MTSKGGDLVFEKPVSNDAAKSLYILYREYLNRRSRGTDKIDALRFGSSSNIRNDFLSECSISDVDSICHELKCAGFMDCRSYDNHVMFSSLTSEAIVYMENRFKKGISEVIDAISKLR